MSCESHSVVVVIILLFSPSVCPGHLDSDRSDKIDDRQQGEGEEDLIECFRVVFVYCSLSP